MCKKSQSGSWNGEVNVTVTERFQAALVAFVNRVLVGTPCPQADLDACQARLWSRSVSKGRGRSGPRKASHTSKQKPAVLFPVELLRRNDTPSFKCKVSRGGGEAAGGGFYVGADSWQVHHLWSPLRAAVINTFPGEWAEFGGVWETMLFPRKAHQVQRKCWPKLLRRRPRRSGGFDEKCRDHMACFTATAAPLSCPPWISKRFFFSFQRLLNFESILCKAEQQGHGSTKEALAMIKGRWIPLPVSWVAGVIVEICRHIYPRKLHCKSRHLENSNTS